MIIAIGTARAASGRRDEMLEACSRVALASQSDTGCVEYGFHASIDDPDVVTSIEIWESQEALDEHMSHGHTAEFLTTVAALTDGEPQMRFLRAEPVT